MVNTHKRLGILTVSAELVFAEDRFTSEIVLFATFWHGFFLGAVMYGLIIIVLGTAEKV